MGIEDPDPTVDRKGSVSVESSVEVEMFDRDLKTLRAENKGFSRRPRKTLLRRQAGNQA